MTSHPKCPKSSVMLIIVAMATFACEEPGPPGSHLATAPTPVAGTPSSVFTPPGGRQVQVIVHMLVNVDPGVTIARLATAAATIPLTNLRFEMGGRSEISINRITGTTGTPDISFPGGASPSEVTRTFVLNPITSDSSDFDIWVTNPLANTVPLEIAALFEVFAG